MHLNQICEEHGEVIQRTHNFGCFPPNRNLWTMILIEALHPSLEQQKTKRHHNSKVEAPLERKYISAVGSANWPNQN